MIFSLIFVAVLAAILVVSIRRPFVGLLALIFLSTFYTILREASAGSALFFIWPYIVYGELLLIAGLTEGKTLLGRQGISRPGLVLGLGLGGLIVALAALLEGTSGGISVILADTSLRGLGTVLSGRAFAIAVSLVGLVALLCIAMILRAIAKREGAIAWMDWTVLAFLLYGGLQVINTYLRNSILFTGLNGLRYYFVAAAIYFPARYLIDTPRHRRQFAAALLIACFAGSLELMFENYLLNVRGIAPNQIAWVGHLYREFEYTPDPDRGFFEGNYFPLGFMYMTHVSGLFLLLGFALCVPRVLVARTWRVAAPYLVLAALIVASAVWTSRTVLVLIVVSYIVAAMLVRSSFTRRAIGFLGLLAFLWFASHFLIPGVRYDIEGETKFLVGRAVPNLLGAVVVDLTEIRGARRAEPGWQLIGTGTAQAADETTPSGGRALVIRAAKGETEYRAILPASLNLKGKTVRLDVWVKAQPGSQVTIQLTDGQGTSFEDHRGKGQWELVSVTRQLNARTESPWVDIDVAAGGTAAVDRVTLEADSARDDGADEPKTPRGRMILLESGKSVLWNPGAPVPILDGSAGASGSFGENTRPFSSDDTLVSDPPEAVHWNRVLFGYGAQFAEWNLLFFKDFIPNSFAVATYSDTKYLEFAQQFGIVGLFLLVWMGATGIWLGVMRTLRTEDPISRAEFAGLTVILVITYISLLHLPSLFKIGYNTAVFVALAALVSGRASSTTAQRFR